MPSHYPLARPALTQERRQAIVHVTLEPRRPSILLTFTVGIILTLSIVMFSVVTVARLSTSPNILDLPLWLRPGSVLTEDGPCPYHRCCAKPLGITTDEHLVCNITLDGMAIEVTFDDTGQTILQTVMAIHQHTIGDLIRVWGRPTGFARYGRSINVYWGVRYAYLSTCSFQSDSPVEFVVYYLHKQQASHWLGFTRATGNSCLASSSSPEGN